MLPEGHGDVVIVKTVFEEIGGLRRLVLASASRERADLFVVSTWGSQHFALLEQ